MAEALAQLPSTGPGLFQNLAYGYDYVGNILGQANKVAVPPQNELGGPTQQTFDYDKLYRLTVANGSFTPSRRGQHQYSLAMAYDRTHNITFKGQESTFVRNGSDPRIERATTYDWTYSYKDNGHKQPHAPTHIGNRSFNYDKNGNQTGWTHDKNGTRRNITWDEENRIQAIGDPSNTLKFAYDDRGTRMLKRGQHGQTVYVNQFFTVRNQALASKHIFAGTSRVATKVEPGAPIGTDPGNKTTDTTVQSITTTASDIPAPASPGIVDSVINFFTGQTTPSTHPGQGLEHRSDRANERAQNTVKNPNLNGGFPGGEEKGNNGGGNGGGNGNPGGGNPGNGGGNPGNGGGNTGGGSDPLLHGGEFLYFYHPDHLGSTSHVTDDAGELYEHITYFPFGETWVQEAANTNQRIPYRYTSKELDEETGLYYFGARYYDPRTSVWQSADAILGQYLDGDPNGGVFSPKNLGMYTYTHNNPVLYTDPDGNALIFGAIVGAVLDVGIQTVLIATGRQEEFSVTSVIVSAASGALGVGLATKINQARKLTTLQKAGASIAGDVTVSVGATVAKGEKVTPLGVAADVVLGQAGGKAAGKFARNKAKASNENTILNRQADRAERIANNPKVGRPNARQRQAQQARDAQQGFLSEAEVRGGTVGSGLGQTAAQGTLKMLDNDNDND